MAVGRTAADILGIDAPTGNVKGSHSDGAKRSTLPAYRGDDEAVSRVSGEHTDQPNPHPDQRRDGVPGTPVNITTDAEVDHDGYMGRGSGKKTVDAGLTDR
jgi:hypothetical protein